MKKTTITMLILFIVQIAHSQNYQKSFGKVFEIDNTDQQEFYDIIDNNQSLIAAGTFRNLDTFPVIGLYGTLSKINKNGTVNWYKAYVPSDLAFQESFLIKSIVSAGGEIFALGTFLSLGTNSAYMLIKLDSDGHVLFTKKIKDALPGMDPKLITNNSHLFAVLGDKIAKFDLQGNLVRTVSSPFITYRDILFDSGQNIVAVGDYINEDPNAVVNTGLPIVRLTQELDFVNGTIIYSDTQGTLYAHCAINYGADNIVIGGSSSYLSVDSDNTVQWARLLPTNFDENTFVVDDYGSFWKFQKDSNQKLYFIASGFFSNDDAVVGRTFEPQTGETYFQYYTAIGQIDPVSGSVLQTRDIRNGHFDAVDHLELYSFIIDGDMLYGAGRTRDYDGQYHVNYIHATDLNQLNCGESNRTIANIDMAQDIDSVPLDGSAFSDQALIITNISTAELDIPVNYEDQSCSEALGIDENELVPITLVPNPAVDRVTVEGAANVEKIVIFDQLGRVVKTLASVANNEFDVSSLATGVYHVKLITDGNAYSKKLIRK